MSRPWASRRPRGGSGSSGGGSSPSRSCPPARSWRRPCGRPGPIPEFHRQLDAILHDYAGRPTPVTECPRLSERLGVRILLKREDLTHTGSHKINNVMGQALLARRMGKTPAHRRDRGRSARGGHGHRRRLLRDGVRGLHGGGRHRAPGPERLPDGAARGRGGPGALGQSKTLKDAVNEAMRAWVAEVGTTHYCLGSVMGPHPYPWMVRELQRVVGDEARGQCREILGRAGPRLRGGLRRRGVERGGDLRRLRGHRGPSGGGGGGRRGGGEPRGTRGGARDDVVPAAGRGGADQRGPLDLGRARLSRPRARARPPGRRSAGPATGWPATTRSWTPSGCWPGDRGIIPALEPAHALAWVVREAGKEIPSGSTVLITLSGRGDKDVAQVSELLR